MKAKKSVDLKEVHWGEKVIVNAGKSYKNKVQ